MEIIGTVQQLAEADRPLGIAFISAAVALGAYEPEQRAACLNWPFIGRLLADGKPVTIEDHEVNAVFLVEGLADFVRDFPEAPGEALFRHARSLRVHEAASDGWLAIPTGYRTAYMIFRDTLIAADREAKAEEARAAARQAAEKVQPPVMVPAEDTILEQHGTIMERVGDKPAMVNLGGKDGAEMGAAAGEAAVAAQSDAAAEPPAALAGAVAGPQDAATGNGADPAALGADPAHGAGDGGEPAAPEPDADGSGSVGAAADGPGDDRASAPVADADAPGGRPADPAPEAHRLAGAMPSDATVSLAAARDADKAAAQPKTKRKGG